MRGPGADSGGGNLQPLSQDKWEQFHGVPSAKSTVCCLQPAALQHRSTRHTWQDTNQMNLYDFHCSQKTCWLSKDILPGQMMESSPTCSHQSHSSLATDTCAECTAISNVELRFESIISQCRIRRHWKAVWWKMLFSDSSLALCGLKRLGCTWI